MNIYMTDTGFETAETITQRHFLIALSLSVTLCNNLQKYFLVAQAKNTLLPYVDLMI